MLVALYVRRSTDENRQPESLESQEEILRAYAAREGYSIGARVYRDSGSGRSTRHRPAFRELIDTVRNGAPFEAILVRDVSRWGRFLNVDESAYWEFVCLTHGVRVIYVEERFGEPSPAATLMKALKRWGAAEASLDRGRITTYGKARAVRNGFASGAPCPYGMRRALVDRDGAFLQFLERGERKVLTTQHVKLAPGDPAEISVVQTIFRLYAEGWLRSQIAAHLRLAGVPSPRVRHWTAANVTDVLQNEAYVGTSVLHTKAEIVRTPDSWPEIVERALWDVAERRLRREIAEHGRRKAALGIPRKERITRRTPRPEYAAAAATQTDSAIETLRRQLAPALSSDAQTPCGSSAHFAISFPRATKHALYWAFSIDRNYDVTIGVGFAAPPDVRIVSLYFFDHARICATNLFPRVHAKTPHRRAVDVPHLRRRLELHVQWEKVGARVTEAVRDVALLDVPALARQLGWPLKRTRAIVEGLERRGVPLPPRKIKVGRRITVVCDSCGAARELAPAQALKRHGSKCRSCWDGDTAHGREIVTCPFCSATREVRRSAFLKLTRGNATPCRRCQASRRSTDRSAVRRPLLTCRAAMLNELADAVVLRLRADFEIYRRPRKRASWGIANPSIYWTCLDGTRQRLVLYATDAAIERGVDIAAELERVVLPANWSAGDGAKNAAVTFRYTVK